MNLLLHGIEDFKIVKEDTLRNPAFFEGDKLAQFDCVIANPPFSLENWGEETWLSDSYGRNTLGGVPPKKNADWAWVQHMYKSMDIKSGRIAVVLPQGSLFRSGAEGRGESKKYYSIFKGCRKNL
jgi:type I restriction enzyme M protein